MFNFPKSIAVRKAQGSQFIPDLRAAVPGGFRGKPVIADAACASQCRACAEVCPSRAIALDAKLRPETLCVSVIEGVRGPVVQVLETSVQGALLHYKVQDPSLPNWFGLAMAVRDNGISDFPICNKSFDLSYCGNDL